MKKFHETRLESIFQVESLIGIGHGKRLREYGHDSPAVKDGRELIVVIMHCGFTKNEKWIDAKTLFEYGFQLLEGRD